MTDHVKTNETPTIEAVEICRHFGTDTTRVDVLRTVCLQVEAGEWVAIMGPSGSGKTTLLHALGGLEPVDSGSISISGESLSHSEASRARRRRNDVAFVFQQYNLLGDLTALDNVALPLRMQGLRRRAARGQASSLLDRLGLVDRMHAHPAQLSGGEQQRVAIARALAVEPVVLMADEPTGALDSDSGSLVLDLLRSQHERGQTIVMVTHDHRVASAADRVVTMHDGQLVDEHRMRAVHASDLQHLISLDVGR